ncbi:MAG: N-6 DNA methylase, partial [Desulfatiglandales bacterium]
MVTFIAPSLVKLLEEIIETYSGRVYDTCCGSAGMYVSRSSLSWPMERETAVTERQIRISPS